MGSALHPSTFDSMALLSDPQDSTWVVTASGRKDMLWGALERIGTIEMSSSHTPAAEGLGPGTVTVTVVGADEDAVRAKVDSVLPRAAGEFFVVTQVESRLNVGWDSREMSLALGQPTNTFRAQQRINAATKRRSYEIVMNKSHGTTRGRDVHRRRPR
jgi:hypothetical protein